LETLPFSWRGSRIVFGALRADELALIYGHMGALVQFEQVASREAFAAVLALEVALLVWNMVDQPVGTQYAGIGEHLSAVLASVGKES